MTIRAECSVDDCPVQPEWRVTAAWSNYEYDVFYACGEHHALMWHWLRRRTPDGKTVDIMSIWLNGRYDVSNSSPSTSP